MKPDAPIAGSFRLVSFQELEPRLLLATYYAVTDLGTLGGDELLACEPQELLRRLFGAHDIRLFDGESVHFECRCSRERVASMLRGLGQAEVDSIIAEQGAVSVTCEFCQRPYRFDVVDAQRLFLPPSGVVDPGSIN